ncbi:VOC family protein [Cohnella luojiensis]|uniref:Glyoxalase n=1 Tax=Cohnella luojiensis TaxID=652876 RepID=A0A4Y8LUJ3_9BACL|nr:VOC family protein [Cohnella luojiensis]TFE22588.1 glyoxalase [Cohnella luojiensis]
MVPNRVSLVTIGAVNLPELRKFYQKLGWSETAISSDSYCVFETAGVLLSLYPLQELANDSGIDFTASKDVVSRITLAINVDNPEQVDLTATEVRTAGGRIVREPSNASWGGRIAYFLDPENNLWEIAWNPTAIFDERGAMITF